MSEPLLHTDTTDGIATFTLNRPQAMNALSRALRAAVTEAFIGVARDPDVRVVILTGSGRAFCAGLDLKELGGEASDTSAIASAVGGNDMIATMRACPQPVIGAINGFAITGGFEMALACDLLIASTEARFADTHARVGILPGWGLSQILPRVIGLYRAKELSLTGNYLGAEQAAAWGLVSRVVPPAELLPTCQALARDMLSCDPASLRGYKRVINDGFAATLADGLRIEAEANRAHARGLTPEAIAARRQDVQARGRSQSKGS